MFTESFDCYACEGDYISCEVKGRNFVATIYRDNYSGTPDERQDGFWSSLDPKDAGYIGPKSKTVLARMLARERQVLRAWKEDEWFYCGVCVVELDENGDWKTGEFDNALWGVECNYPTFTKKNKAYGNGYLRDVANDLLSQIV